MSTIPKNFPKNIQYSNDLVFTNIYPKKTNLIGVEIREITNENHKLFGEYGLFAKRRWKKFEIIGDYTGEVCNSNNEGDYVANLYHDLPSNESIGIDSINYGNETRFINDYRGINDIPNTKIVSTVVGGISRILFVVIEDIATFEEILTDYGEEYWEAMIQLEK